LQELVKTYPQSGLFRALYGRALNQGNPAIAAAYFDGRALYKLLNHYDNLLVVDKAQLIIQGESQPLNGQAANNSFATEHSEKNDNAIFTDQPTAFPDIQWPGKQEEEEKKEEEPKQDIEDKYVAPEPVVEQTPEPTPWQPEEQPAPAPESNEPLGRAPWEMEDEEDEPHVAETPAEFAPWQPTEEAHEEAAPEPLLDNVEEPAAWPTEEETYTPEESTEYHTPFEPEPVAEAEPSAWETPAEEYQAPAEESVQWPPYAEEGETVIDEETYDEITGIDDIEMGQQVTNEPVAPYGGWAEEEESPIVPVEHAYEEPYGETEEQNEPAQHDEAEKLIMGNIAATDYFTFDRAFGDNKKPEEPAQPDFYATPQEVAPQQNHSTYKQPAQNDVSRYHDEKMPYTFMWWLDKTRKEHGRLYQPYVKAPANPANNQPKAAPVNTGDKTAAPDELQQQYFENIFHLSSVDELTNDADAPTIEFDMQSKEDRIIQRFITEDPHIHPPVGEKLDSENKAKKSSEDSNDLVTETLARIYADQMLYPKAIATYKKLMLKYPEKSRYFASRIENLEKKTN
jgi:hypothetical protein